MLTSYHESVKSTQNGMFRYIVLSDCNQTQEMINNEFQRFPTETVSFARIEVKQTVDESLVLARPDLVFIDTDYYNRQILQSLSSAMDAVDCDIAALISSHPSTLHLLEETDHTILSYILKPINTRVLHNMIQRSVNKYMVRHTYSRLFREIHLLSKRDKKIGVSTRDGVVFINVSDIVRCESDSNYTRFYFVNGDSLLASKTLKEFEDILVMYAFARVHKSHLVNISHVKKYVKGESGYLIMVDESEVEVSRRNREMVASYFTDII